MRCFQKWKRNPLATDQLAAGIKAQWNSYIKSWQNIYINIENVCTYILVLCNISECNIDQKTTSCGDDSVQIIRSMFEYL